MKELKDILNTIIIVMDRDIDNDEKHNLLSNLWTRYYKLSNMIGIELEEECNLKLLCTDVSFIVKQDSLTKQIDYKLLDETIKKIQSNYPISESEATNILNWTVENTKYNLSTILHQLGKKVESDSLTGFCETGQALSLMPLENIGVKVTKNNSIDTFNYLGIHAFGTATFDIIENGSITQKTYLIDTTYRQFFTTVNCNEGKYYDKNSVAPDPGYFADKDFARELLKNGYVELNETTAKLYGEPFYKASLPLNQAGKNIDFYHNIMNIHGNYSANKTDLEGFDIKIKEVGTNHY